MPLLTQAAYDKEGFCRDDSKDDMIQVKQLGEKRRRSPSPESSVESPAQFIKEECEHYQPYKIRKVTTIQLNYEETIEKKMQ